MILPIWSNLWCLSGGKKPTSCFTFSLRYCKVAILSILSIHVSASLYLQEKINFIPCVFLKILQRYANFLFWVLWACLAMYTQKDSFNLYKTSMFICIPKINFIIHFFLEILYPMTREPEFWQILDWWWNINNNISFHLWLCPGKTKKTIFQKTKKKLFGVILGPFPQNLGKNEFS